MKPTSMPFAVSAALALAIALAIAPVTARAQKSSANDAAITAAAQKIYKAIADDDADAARALVVKKYAKKVTKESMRPTQTGPKLGVAFDGNVKILRSTDKDAVVQATMFTPPSDVPKGEADKLDVYLVNQNGTWLADAPDHKQAGTDATMDGGWYHSGAFTWCPNRGLEYVGSHFSNKLNCRATAVCR